jgi:hypothetical protein
MAYRSFSNYQPKKRDYVLTQPERIREKVVLALCMVMCLGFFVKIVFL